MGFTKEERAERARKAGQASAAKRAAAKATADSQVVVPPEESMGEIVAPALDHTRVHPQPQADPVPVVPVSFGTAGRMAARSLEEAMEGPPEMPGLAAELARPEAPPREVEELHQVVGTDVGAGTVYCLGNVTWNLQDVERLPNQIPGPGDALVRYKGAARLVLKTKE